MGTSTSKYAELRCRTHYSFLRGASHPAELMARANELGLHSLAITDRNGVYGIPKAYAASREQETRTKLIVGSELTLAGETALEKLPPLFLLAKNRQGYGVMCRLLSASHEGKEKGRAALDWERFTAILSEFGAGGLFASPAELQRGNEEFYGNLKTIFGKDLFFPVSRFLDGHDRRRVDLARALSGKFGVPLAATCDVHFHVPAKKRLQDVLSAIRETKTLAEMGTELQSNAERYLKSPEKMAKLFEDLPEALAQTVEIAEQCRFSPSELRYRYPSEWIPAGETARSYLEKLVWKGADWRYQGDVPEKTRKQLVHELKLTQELGYADYFLTIWEVVEFAREKKILCQGRGSAANSAICYCLGITAIDPVRMDLLFERFISAERNEPPDIDVDFEHERREEVIQHIYQKYGRHRAGMVANVICYRERSSRREVNKVFGLSPEEKAPSDPKTARLVEEMKEQIESFPRHLGIHSGGFTLSKDPLIETVPIEPARMENRTVVQWDKDDLACIGLLKVDILALGMLTALRKTLDLVKTSSGRELTVATIPEGDASTYEMIQKGDTVGVFQIESRAQMNMLKRLQPRNFYDLVIEIALVRPGPIMGEMVHPYLKRRRGLEKIDIPHPLLEPILGRTLGVPLFQEQVMKMAITLAGFTPGEADELRRAINAWKSKGNIDKMGKKLMDGLLARGLQRDFVERVFKQIHGFAEYGFPESHSASFAVLAYASSFLKRHHPAEFFCALINSQPMGFYSTHTLVEQAKHDGVRVLPVDINRSHWDCEVMEGGRGEIRIGFCVVRGIGEEAARELLASRAKRPFASLMDFLSRTRLSLQGLQSLAMGEAFACFGLNQRDSLWEILAHRVLTRPTRKETGAQMNLFEGLEGKAGKTEEGAGFPALDDFQAIRSDYRSYGLSTRGHPMREFRRSFTNIPRFTTGFARKSPIGRFLKIAGLVIARQRPPNAKGTCFATLEDEEGFLDLILHDEIFERYKDTFVSEPFIIATGKIQRDATATSLIVSRIASIDEDQADIRVRSKDFG